MGKPQPQTVAWSYDMEGHGQKMRWATLWTSKQESGAKVQSFKPLFGWSSIQAGGTRISWRNVRSLLTNCLEMPVHGTNWTTWHSVAGQQACEISHKWTQARDRRSARLISYIHHTNDFRQFCHVGNTAQHCRLCPFDLEDSKSTSGGF